MIKAPTKYGIVACNLIAVSNLAHQNKKKRNEAKMIAITADEKKIIHERFPDVHIVRTMRQDSKRHHYYMTEDKKPMKLLRKLREYGVNHTEKERGVNRHPKNRK